MRLTNKKLRSIKVAASSFIILLLHLPFVFAKSKSRFLLHAPKEKTITYTDTANYNFFPSIVPSLTNVYDSLKLNIKGLSRQAFDLAVKGFEMLTASGKISNEKIITIADFSKPSSEKRLFVLDLKNYKVLYHTYVAHGANSGLDYARKFSNTPESNMSSLGFYRTGSTYDGANGYSLKLVGLESGFNNNAENRSIVMHGADYVSEDYAESQGFIGRSWGCPAVARNLSKPIIDKIKNGSCLFIYSPDNNYLKRSRFLN